MAEFDELDQAVEGVLRGRKEQFEVVIRKFHVPVRAFISALVHDRNDADDLAQQAFVFAYQHLDEYRPGTHFLAWLKAIARNLVMDHHKRHAQRHAIHERYLRELAAAKASEILGPREVDLRLEMLQRCIDRLPEEQRDFLRQVHSRNRTLEEMAHRLQRSALAVRKQSSRLHELLRQCIDRHLAQGEITS